MPGFLERGQEIIRLDDLEHENAFLILPYDLDDDFRIGELQDLSRLYVPLGAEKSPPYMRLGLFEKERLHFAQRPANAVYASGDDARVVYYEKVAGLEVLAYVTEDTVLYLPRLPVKNHEARRVARLGGRLGDPVRRQFVIEKCNFHTAFLR